MIFLLFSLESLKEYRKSGLIRLDYTVRLTGDMKARKLAE